MNLPPSRFTTKSSNGIQQNFLYLFLKIPVSGYMYILIEICCWNTKGTREYGHTYGPDTCSSRGFVKRNVFKLEKCFSNSKN